MARCIVVSLEEWEAAFKACRETLELEKFREKERRGMDPLDDLHRAFHYHVCALKDRLERG